MGEYWKSLPKKHCVYCNFYYIDNNINRRNHEKSDKHKERMKVYLAKHSVSQSLEESSENKPQDLVFKPSGKPSGKPAILPPKLIPSIQPPMIVKRKGALKIAPIKGIPNATEPEDEPENPDIQEPKMDEIPEPIRPTVGVSFTKRDRKHERRKNSME